MAGLTNWQRFLILVLVAVAIPGLSFADSQAKPESRHCVITLKNGNAMHCVLLSEDKNSIKASWQGLEILLERNEIARIDHEADEGSADSIVLAEHEAVDTWKYRNNPVLLLNNNQIVDAQIEKAREGVITVRKPMDGGGWVEMDFPQDKIDHLLFRPVTNAESAKIEERLRGLFPKMRVHRLGLVTLFTDSEGSSLKTLKNTLTDQMQQIYFNFFDLLKNRQPQIQHFVVIFDRLSDYYQYAATDGVPAWICPGYFSPEEKTLFLVNYGGDQLTEILYQVVLGQREAVDSYAGQIKGQVDAYYHGIIEGQAREVKIRIENALAYMTSTFSELTINVLRHELTHEFFHSWGLQTIVVSGMVEPDPDTLRKKRELLETDDLEKKKALILELIRAKEKNLEQDEVQINAANSWFVEGTAEYMATTGIGLENRDRLYALQETLKAKELWPIENLTNYRMGSFPGVSTKVALAAYAQSWNFVDFLMKKHRGGFFNYLEKMSQKVPEEHEDIDWLTQCVGKDLRSLEKEWVEYIGSFETIEDPQIDRWFRVRQILNSS